VAPSPFGVDNREAPCSDRLPPLYADPIDTAKVTRMHYGHAQYLPIAPSLFALLAVALGILLILVQIRVLRYAYMKQGVSSGRAFLLLFGSLLGSYVNIPIAALGPESMVTEREVTYYGMRYVVPALANSPKVILAVNVGGAVIPTLLSIYLLWKNGLWGRGLIATAIIAAICHALAQPIRGVGIGLPIFVAPVAAAIVAAIVSWRYAAPLVYAGGSLGVLNGADLLNLDKLQGLGAPVLSIGGAGTFDGIFVTGMMAVLLAGFTGGGRRDERVEAPRPRRRAC
jgi:uncharacterized membrane protein